MEYTPSKIPLICFAVAAMMFFVLLFDAEASQEQFAYRVLMIVANVVLIAIWIKRFHKTQ